MFALTINGKTHEFPNGYALWVWYTNQKALREAANKTIAQRLAIFEKLRAKHVATFEATHRKDVEL